MRVQNFLSHFLVKPACRAATIHHASVAFLALWFALGVSSTTSAAPTSAPASAPAEPPNAVRISCYERGVYRVMGEDLARQGVDLKAVDLERMALVHYDQSVPIYCVGLEDRHWDPQDSIYFFAEGSTQDTIPYVNIEKDYYPRNQLFMLHLRATSHEPLRYKTIAMKTPSRPDPQTYPVQTFSGLAHFEANPIYQFFETTNYAINKTDFIFWQKLTFPASDKTGSMVSLPFELPSADLAKEAQLELLFFAASESFNSSLNHRVAISVNGKPLGQVKWAQSSRHQASIKLPANTCHKGINQLELTLLEPQSPGQVATGNSKPGGVSMLIDMVFLDWFNLRFKQPAEAANDSNELVIADPSDKQVARRFSIRNFSSPDILVFDLAAKEMLKAAPFNQIAGSQRFAVNLEREAKPSTLIAVSAAKAKKPVEMRPITIRGLFTRPEECDMIVLTHPVFKPALEPFLAWKRSRGLKVRMTDIVDIFNECSGGYAGPEAMRRYLNYVSKHQRATKLRYVLLVGDSATISKYQSFCPAYAYLQSGTHANDNYFANFEDPSGKPEFAVGRFSVSTSEQLANIIRKTLDYESGKLVGSWQSNFLLIAAAFNWAKKDALDVVNLCVKPNLRASLIKTDTKDPDPSYHQKLTLELMRQFNAGHLVTVFMGHGGGSVWEVGPSFNGENVQKHLFDQTNVAQLTNEKRPTLVFAMTCYTNDFEGLNLRQTLGETFVNSRGGAIAVIGASGRSAIDVNSDFVKKFLGMVAQRKFARLGDYFMETKSQLNSGYVNYNYLLLGDPSLEFNLPAMDVQIARAHCANPSTTLQFDYTLPAQVKAPARLECFLVDENESPVEQWSMDAAAVQGEARHALQPGTIVRNMRLIACLSDGASGLHVGAAVINPAPKQTTPNATRKQVGKPPLKNLQITPQKEKTIANKH